MIFPFVSWLCNFGQCTTRCLIGFWLSVLFGFCVFHYILPILQKKNINQIERDQSIIRDLAKVHVSKTGTPTLGGIMILLSVIFPILLLAKLNFYVVTTLVICFSFCFLGLLDDFFKLYKRNIKGICGKHTLFYEGILTFILLITMYIKYGDKIGSLLLPVLDISNISYVWLTLLGIFIFFVLVGTSNAVNLTDGLDGLATISLLPNFVFFGILALISGSECLSSIFNAHFLPGVEELAVVFSCFIGGLINFLWYNSYPSSIMMGDTGSLMLGGLLGVGALLLMKPFFLLLTGIIFVLEVLSDILQVGSFKFRRGKRIFLMAPLHHHFELSGVCEPKIVARAGLISFLMFTIALFLLVLC